MGNDGPLGEEYYSISHYSYCLNNPIRFIDPDGKVVGDPDPNNAKFKLPFFSELAHATLFLLGLDYQSSKDNTSEAAKEADEHNN